jgi:hypothetical protein
MASRKELTKINKFLRKPWVAVLLIPIALGIGLYAGAAYQSQVNQNQLNIKLDGIECSNIQGLVNQYNSDGQSAQVIANPDGSCGIQFGLGATIHVSACVNVTVGRANGTTIEDGCSANTTSSTNSSS